MELLSARIALEKRYKNFITNSKNKTGTELWKHALNSMGIKTPKLAPIPKRKKGQGLIIAANHPFAVTDGLPGVIAKGFLQHCLLECTELDSTAIIMAFS